MGRGGVVGGVEVGLKMFTKFIFDMIVFVFHVLSYVLIISIIILYVINIHDEALNL